MNDRIISALKTDAEKQTPSEPEPVAEQRAIDTNTQKENNIVTTNDELQAFYIIKSILYGKVPIEKIAYKDTESYFSILFDNNIRKWICRLDLNGSKLKLYIQNANKETVKYDLSKLDSLYDYATQIIESAMRYL